MARFWALAAKSWDGAAFEPKMVIFGNLAKLGQMA